MPVILKPGNVKKQQAENKENSNLTFIRLRTSVAVPVRLWAARIYATMGL